MDINKVARAPNAPNVGGIPQPTSFPYRTTATAAPPRPVAPEAQPVASPVDQINKQLPISPQSSSKQPSAAQPAMPSTTQSSPPPAFASAGFAPPTPLTPQSTRPAAPANAQTKATSIIPPPRKPVSRRRVGLLVAFSVLGILVCAGIAAVVWALLNNKNDTANSTFATVQIPLSDLVSADGLSLLGTRSLTVNGALIANQAFIISPSAQPSNAMRGQIYFDQTSNKLSYFNGSGFVEIADSGTGFVTTIAGQSGAIGIGQGLTSAGGQIANSGVLSVQGQTGNIAFTAGNGIAIAGTNISNTGVVSVASSSATITVANDGNGNITIGGSGGGGSGTVQSPGGTAGRIAKFTGVQTIADSLISEIGPTVIVSGNLDVTGALSLGSPLVVGNGGTGTNSLTLNGVVVGNGVGALSAVTAGGAGLCLVSTAGAPAFSVCPAAAGVSSLNGLTGTLTIANATTAGTTITMNDASTSQKGIASFNSTNFTASSGAINTIQDINTTAAPTFGRLTLSSSQAASTMLLINNTHAGASGNLLDLQTNSVTQMSVGPAGAMTLLGTLNGQTISAAANFTGTLGVGGLASLNGGASVTGTLTANTITPNAAMTIGATNQSLLLQGNALTTLTATNGANTTTVSFVSPTANVTYRLQTATAGTYDICTTVGNCAGTGGGVTTAGGTLNRLAKFTGAQTIADSIITDDGATVTIGGTLSVNTLTPTSALTVGATGQSFLLQGNASSTVTATNAGNTTTVSFATPTANVVYRFATATAGTYDICTTVGNCAGTGGGVTTAGGTNGRIAKFTGAQTIADSLLSEAGSTITVNGTLSANTITPTAAMTIGTASQSFLLQGSATSTVTATDGANTTTLSFVAPTANVTYRLQTAAAGTYDICTSVNNCNSANAALSNLSGVAINASLTPGAAGAVDLGGAALPFRDLYIAGNSGAPATNNFKITGTATGARTITLPDASGAVCIDTNNCSYVSLQAGSPGAAQTGNINVGGTVIAGTAMQAPLLTTADATSGSTAALTLRTGDLTGGSSTSTGAVTVRSGNASGTATNSGNISIDAGTATGITGTLSLGTTNASAVSAGNVGAALSLYGSAASTMTFQNGVNTTTLSFQAPTANVTYRFPAAAAGSYDICTTVGNCAGTGGGVTTIGGTNGRIAKFTGSQTIADSLLSETGSTVTVDGNLNLILGSQFQINGAQISSANLSNDANLAKLNLTQTFTGSSNIFKNASDSVDAFSIQSATSQRLLTADTTGSQIILGTASGLAGKLTFQNATNTNTISIIPSVATGTRTITLPDESGTVCLQSSANCGFAASSGSNSYIRNGTAIQTADFNISGTGTAGIVQSYIFDAPDASALAIGSTNATAINLNQNTTVAAGKSLTVTSALTSLTGAATGDALVVSNATSTGRIAVFKDGASEVFVVANGGSTSVTTTVDSTTAFTVQGTAVDSVLSADTFNNTVKLRSLFADSTSTYDAIWLQGNKNAVTAFIGGNDNVDAYTANESSANMRFNGANVAWGDFGYYPTGGGAGSFGHFRMSTTGSAINTTPNAKLGVGDLYVASEIGIGITNPTEALDVSGNINIGSANSYKVGGVIAMEATGSYLRINQSNQFSNGIYTGTSGVRVGGVTGVLVGSAGGDGQIALVPDGLDNVRRITLNGGTGSIQGFTATLTGATSGDALTVSNATSTGNVAVFKDDATTVASIANGGAATFQNSTNSTAAFRVLSSGGGSLFNVDSTNGGAASLLGMNSGEISAWATSANALTAARSYAATATYNGYAYVIGGDDTGGTAQSTVYYSKLNSDGTVGTWNTNGYPLPAARTSASAIVQNGYLYVLGGSTGGTEQATVYFTRLNGDGSTGSWYTTTVLPAARSNGGVVASNGYMYYIGGQSSTDVAQNTTYYAKINGDGTLEAWTSGTAISFARKSAEVVVANGYLYVIGGVGNTGSYQTSVYYAALNADTGAIGAFNSTTSMPGNRAESSVLIANGYVYIIGGRNSLSHLASLYYSKLAADGTVGAWSTAANALPALRGGGSSFIANGFMYMIGGYDGAVGTNTVYYSSVARVQIGASLDLVGLQGQNLVNGGDTAQGSTGGSITAGNGTFVGSMQVQGMTNLNQGLSVNGITTLNGSTYVAGDLSLSSELAAYEGFENVTFPPSGGTGTWTTGGNANWARSTTIFDEGIASAASGTITHSQESWLDMDYTFAQSGTITFSWRVSSEENFDYLEFCVDNDASCTGNTEYSISGESGWQQVTVPVAAGAHSFRWVYNKDVSATAGNDKGWVDNVRFNGGSGAITGNGINLRPAADYNVSIGQVDTAATLFVLDSQNGSALDPTSGPDGSMYYNNNMQKFRCLEAGIWKDCINTPLTTRVYAASAQAIPTDTDTRLTFATVDSDYAPITITDNNKFQLDRTGTWNIQTSMRYANGTGGSGERYLAIANSVASGQPTPRYGQTTLNGSNSYSSALSTGATVYFDAVTTISIYTFQSSAGSLNALTNWNGTVVSFTWLGY